MNLGQLEKRVKEDLKHSRVKWLKCLRLAKSSKNLRGKALI